MRRVIFISFSPLNINISNNEQRWRGREVRCQTMNMFPPVLVHAERRIWSRETGSAIPSHVSLQPAHSPLSGWIIYHLSPIWSLLLLTGFPPLSETASIYLYCQPPSGQSRVSRIAQLRTDCVHCREHAGAGPVVLKVLMVRLTGVTFSGTIDQFLCASFFPYTLSVQYSSTVDMCNAENHNIGSIGF